MNSKIKVNKTTPRSVLQLRLIEQKKGDVKYSHSRSIIKAEILTNDDVTFKYRAGLDI